MGLPGDTTATVRPTIKLEPVGVALLPTVEPKVARVVVDTHLHLPDMFEITFLDEEGGVLTEAGIRIGTELSIHAGSPSADTAERLIVGEVTSIEAVCEDLHIFTVVRGYEKAHRLQRARRTRTFVKMTDGDIARQVARDAGLDVGTIEDSGVEHAHVSQMAQTDWDFLRQRAVEIGFEVGVAGGELFFRKASGNTSMGGGGLAGAAAGAAASAVGLGGPTLTFKDNLLSFRPRVSAANLTPEVEVRFWDPVRADVVVGRTSIGTGTADLPDDPAQLADQFGKGFLGIPVPIPPNPLLPSFGAQPSNKAVVVADRPLAWGSSADSAADAAALGVAEHVASTFAEAEGEAVGDPAVQAGASVEVGGVPAPFAGKWIVTNARHEFDDEDGGYRTRFFVTGRQERSLLGLASGGAAPPRPAVLSGLVTGIVTNNDDPDKLGRVKVALPWLAPDYESDWARVSQIVAGAGWGAIFTPEVGDEVLLGFEQGDARRPYVLGGLLNGNSEVDLGGDATKAQGMSSQVVKAGFRSHTGFGLVFDDERQPMAPGLPITSAMTLGTADGSVEIKLDQTEGAISIKCAPSPPKSNAAMGTVTIEAGGVGSTLAIKSGGDVTIEAGATGALTLKGGAGGIKVETQGQLEMSGMPIKLN